jgi:hypothetical protein
MSVSKNEEVPKEEIVNEAEAEAEADIDIDMAEPVSRARMGTNK